MSELGTTILHGAHVHRRSTIDSAPNSTLTNSLFSFPLFLFISPSIFLHTPSSISSLLQSALAHPALVNCALLVRSVFTANLINRAWKSRICTVYVVCRLHCADLYFIQVYTLLRNIDCFVSCNNVFIQFWTQKSATWKLSRISCNKLFLLSLSRMYHLMILISINNHCSTAWHSFLHTSYKCNFVFLNFLLH